jgi:hypothetical protein
MFVRPASRPSWPRERTRMSDRMTKQARKRWGMTLNLPSTCEGRRPGGTPRGFRGRFDLSASGTCRIPRCSARTPRHPILLARTPATTPASAAARPPIAKMPSWRYFRSDGRTWADGPVASSLPFPPCPPGCGGGPAAGGRVPGGDADLSPPPGLVDWLRSGGRRGAARGRPPRGIRDAGAAHVGVDGRVPQAPSRVLADASGCSPPLTIP